MLTFQVNDMTCGHCVSSITEAVKAIDPQAAVTTDLAQHRVHIQSDAADSRELKKAIAGAGYTPVPVEARDAAAVNGPRAGGCCCGSGGGRCG